jgi:hypothetical protein
LSPAARRDTFLRPGSCGPFDRPGEEVDRLSGGPRRVALIGIALDAVLVGTNATAAHPSTQWSGQFGPYRWEAKRLSCGAVGGALSRARAHSRWRTSPANGYQRLTFARQIQGDTPDTWTTVQRGHRSTKNKRLEGSQEIMHWLQWVGPHEDQAGKWSRHRVTFAGFLDRPGPDRLVFRRRMTLVPCLVGGRQEGDVVDALDELHPRLLYSTVSRRSTSVWSMPGRRST